MPELKAVPEADPKAGKERRISETQAPVSGLTQSIEVARVLHENGGSLDRSQLAPKLGYSGARNGTFLTRVSAAKIFGLVDQPPQSDVVRITQRGLAIVAQVSDADSQRAKLDAFMSVDLFRAVFEEYKGRPLPPDIGLKNLFEQTYKIIPTRAAQAVKVMLDSAETAGLFTIAGAGSRKMIQPVVSGASDVRIPLSGQPNARAQEIMQGGDGTHADGRTNLGGGGGGGGSPPGNIDAAFIALLSRLPEPGTTLSKTKRENVIAAFTAAINWLYPAPETE